MPPLHCPMCSFVTTDKNFKKEWRSHIKSEHSIDLETCQELQFNDEDDFDNWKEDYCRQTNSQFSRCSTFTNSLFKTIKYRCHRDGHSTPNIITEAASSLKRNNHCPARMSVTILPSHVIARLHPIHLCHEMEPGKSRLSFAEKSLIHDKFEQGMEPSTILSQIRADRANKICKPSEIKRFDLVNLKDIHDAINQVSRISETESDQPEGEVVRPKLTRAQLKRKVTAQKRRVDFEKSLEGWRNNVVFFKKCGEESPVLDVNDYCLIIASPYQLEMLEKHGNDYIIVDSTPTFKNYTLYTIMILDELKEGFPCCFMLTNRSDYSVYHLFYSKLCSAVGILSPQVFMSDMKDAFYKAWSDVMGNSTWLFCSWQILRDWQLNIKKISSRPKREEITHKLVMLMYETCTERFLKLLNESSAQFNDDSETNQFGAYFQNFVNNYDQWAYSFRVYCGINTNIHYDGMYRLLKKIVPEGGIAHNLEGVVSHVDKFTTEAIFKRHVESQRMSTASGKNKLIDDRHSRSIEYYNNQFDLVTELNDFWLITDLARTTYYWVSRMKVNCKCSLRCESCNVCLHTFKCTCEDNAIKINMCIHIHLLAQYISHKNGNLPTDSVLVELEDVNLQNTVEIETTTQEDQSGNDIDMAFSDPIIEDSFSKLDIKTLFDLHLKNILSADISPSELSNMFSDYVELFTEIEKRIKKEY